jgi:microcin C transport system substrate-binding protein
LNQPSLLLSFRKVMPMRVVAKSALIAWVLSLSVACGGGSGPEANRPGTTPAGGGGGGTNAAMDKNAYAVFPNPDSGADPAVPADQGGRGFTGEGWETNTDFNLIGDPRAIKGGRFREAYLDFPNTLRYRGPNVTEFGLMVHGLVYESLLTLHPTTLEWIPLLATHWQVSPDRLTYRYRIDPNARWSDGQPVVADDVVATWSLMMDKGLQDPSAQLVFEKFQKPVAESKYIVRVTSTQLNWRNFLYFSGMGLYPAHVLRNLDGARYIKEYNYKMLPGTGPYMISEADVVRGNSITIRRRPDYWAVNQRRNIGVNNFDEIQEVVVRDENLALEMFKRGDLDFHLVRVAREWVEEMNFEHIQRGLIQKRKIFNEYPLSQMGIAFNTRREPWSDIRVRRALTHLLNRELLIEKLFYNEYEPKNSYFFGNYEDPQNPKNPYDPKTALSLLAEAGWKDRDAQGRLMRNGRPLSMELIYYSKTSEPAFTIYQEDLRKVGISLNLRLVTFETLGRLLDDRQFDTAFIGYTGLLFPNPETSVHSSLADTNNTNNITGVKNARIDALLKDYDVEFDQPKREAIIRDIDGILANMHHWILGWDAPFFRIAFANKFGHPDSYLTRYGDYRDPLSLWWRDSAKEQQHGEALRDNNAKLTVGPTDIHYWENWMKERGSPVATR